MQGKLIIISGPSGSGKTTIVKKLLEKIPALEFSISACNRKKRDNETNGIDYYFLSTEEFKRKIKNDEFVEWEEVYDNQYYGTLRSEIERIWKNNNHAIFDIDVKGGMNLKKTYKEKALAIFIRPPSIEVLEARLKKRATETKKSLEKRISRATDELSYAEKFDKIIINDKMEIAFDKVCRLIKFFI